MAFSGGFAAHVPPTRRKVSRLTLSVKFVDGRRQLPVVEVKIAA